MIRWDSRRNLYIPGNYAISLQFCVKHFISCYQQAVQKHGSFFVALSGGSTPKAIFSLLTQTPFSQEIDWSKVHLFWSDERTVPPTHPESNFHMAMEAGFKNLSIPENQIHRMHAETSENLDQNAILYEAQLPTQGLDLVLLGMGEDGHTASLFPHTQGLQEKKRLVIANYVPQKNTWRMTFTFTCINHHASQAVIYVMGSSKKEIARLALMSHDFLFPIETVGTPERPALWILDEEAASLLTSEC